MEYIYQKINEQQHTFSKSFKKISSIILRNPKIFALDSASDVGKHIGVSETTIIRFCYKLGYKGYSDFQQDVQNRLIRKSSLSDYLNTKNVDSSSIRSLIMNDVQNIKEVVEKLSYPDLERCVEKLSAADCVLVSGAGTSHSMASWFAFTLDMVIGKTRLFQTDTDNILMRLNELSDKSVFIAFSFHRYNLTTMTTAKCAKKQGAFVISITDTYFCPIAKFSDIVIPIQLNVRSSLDATPVVFSVLNAILSTISLKNPENFRNKVEILDSAESSDYFV